VKQARVAVVVTAHNAAGAIAATLRSIAAQDGLEAGALEILVVDDRSTDGTLEAARAAGIAGLRTIRVDTHDEGSGLTSRQRALDLGIRATRAPVVCLTDADALPDRDWIAVTAAPCLEGRAGLSTGPVRFHGGVPWLRALQSVDSAFYLTWCRLLAGVGFESGALFGNAALTRETFERVGGFATIGLSLVEDLSFARAARRAGLRVAYVARAGVSVAACGSLAEFVERARRTSAGGCSALLATLAIWMLSLPLLAGLAWLSHSGWLAGLLAVRYTAGLLLTGTATLRAGAWRALWMVPLYDVLALLLGVVVMASPGTRRPVRWGGLDYPRRPPRA